MGTMIPFPRVYDMLDPWRRRDAQYVSEAVNDIAAHFDYPEETARGCRNGMPGHPPCRSPAELEALLRARADVTAAREGV